MVAAGERWGTAGNGGVVFGWPVVMGGKKDAAIKGARGSAATAEATVAISGN